ncbi:MAG: HPr kinase/phosphorylase, partial [Polyangiaceae bacterium]|nr:HPr kinase/phosphorylase [Polyangiaceae bacterium]
MSDAQKVRVSELFGDELADLKLSVLAGENHLDNVVTHPRVQKPGLAFAGYYEYIKPGRVQIVGESELEYLKTVEEGERRERLRRIAALPIPVVVITKALVPG